jgi:hypothetical protein
VYNISIAVKPLACQQASIIKKMGEYNYLASEEDFTAVEKGIKSVWNPKLSFIFRNKQLIKNTLVISFDSMYIFLWTKRLISGVERMTCKISSFYAYKIRHSIDISEEERLGWQASLKPEKIYDFLPKEFKKNDLEAPKISGSLFGDFIRMQKKIKGEENNPYTTYESYLATIIHEFGHIYFDQHQLWYFSNKQNNIDLMTEALALYSGLKKESTVKISIPLPYFLSEVFAFCTDYSASEIFWPQHKRDIDKKNIQKLEILIKKEKTKNLDIEDSALNSNDPHTIAFILGRHILANYRTDWPKRLLAQTKI